MYICMYHTHHTHTSVPEDSIKMVTTYTCRPPLALLAENSWSNNSAIAYVCSSVSVTGLAIPATPLATTSMGSLCMCALLPLPTSLATQARAEWLKLPESRDPSLNSLTHRRKIRLTQPRPRPGCMIPSIGGALCEVGHICSF